MSYLIDLLKFLKISINQFIAKVDDVIIDLIVCVQRVSSLSMKDRQHAFMILSFLVFIFLFIHIDNDQKVIHVSKLANDNVNDYLTSDLKSDTLFNSLTIN
jgi:hypothetical protein